MSIKFLLLLILVSKTTSSKQNLKVRSNVSQCNDGKFFGLLNPKSPRTALASIPGLCESIFE